MAKPDVHRAINVVLDDDVHDHVHDSSHPKAERAQALLDHLTEVNPLGHHWTTDPKMAPFFHHYNSYGPHTTNVIFHATHPEDHEIITDPGWREEHEVNDSEDEVPVHRGTDMEIKGISWKRNGDEEFTRHDFDDPDYYTASLKSQGMADYFTPRSSFPNDPGYDGNAGISDYFGGGHGGTANDRRVAGRGKPRHRQPAAPGGGGAPAAPGSGAGGAAPGQQRGDAGPGGAGLEGPRSVEFHPRAAKELRKLDGSIQKRAKQVVDALANNNGEGVQTHALANNLAGYYSSKINHDHRIVHRPTDDGGIHIIYVGLHDYDQAARRVSKLSREPGPVTFPYLRNTEGAPDLGSMYGQDVEPHGRYLRYHDGPKPEGDRWETGTASFENPLHMDRGGNSGTPEHWKNRLSEQFGGKKGKALSRAVVKAGHDGIITHDEYGPDEIVDLTSFRKMSMRKDPIRECPCGMNVVFDPQDGWQHDDGSVSHDGEHYGKSVSDLMKTAERIGEEHYDEDDGEFKQLWDQWHPQLQPEIHRHLAMSFPRDHPIWNPRASHEEKAHAILQQASEGYQRPGKLGWHWTDDPDLDFLKSGGRLSYGQHSVVIHAKTPPREHIEDNGWTLVDDRAVKDWNHPEREVPVKRNAPLHITGVSWPVGGGKMQRHDFEQPIVKQAAHSMPTSRIFGPTYGLDHRLFEGEHLKPEVRTAVMARLGPVIEPLLGQDWQRYTKVYLAGSEASEWTSETLEGNGDFDTLIGIDYDHLQGEPGVPVAGLDDDQIDSALNAALRANYNAEPWKAPFGGEWSLTGYVNKASYDITKIKPYAAYNITDDTWSVKPPHLPDWSLDKFPEGGANLVAEAEGYAAVVDAISKMPEPFQTQQGKALWKHLHSDRGRAFSDEGEGWYDSGNVIEKILVEWGVWDKLVDWQYNSDPELSKAPADWSNVPGAYSSSSNDRGKTARVVRDRSERLLALDEGSRHSGVRADAAHVAGAHLEGRTRSGIRDLGGVDSRRARGGSSLPQRGPGLSGWEDLHASAMRESGASRPEDAAAEHPGWEIAFGRTGSSDALSARASVRRGEHLLVEEQAPVRDLPGSTGQGAGSLEGPLDGLTAGAHGGLPEGITYEHELKDDGIHTLFARHPSMPKDGFAGVLSWWDKDGEVGGIEVHPQMQRRGLATELYRRAKEITPHIHHSDYLTPEAKQWISGMEGRTATKLPEGLTFEHRPPSRRYPDDHQLVVHHPDAPHGAFDNYVGHLTWSDHDGEISGAWIAQPWQRKGIGTELFRRAKEITPELHHAPEEERSDAGQAWISGMEGRTAAGPLSIHRGIQLDPGFEPEAAQRIIDGKARPEDLLKHINTDRVGHFWYHPAHAELDDAKEFATGEEEHLKRWHGMGPEYRDEDGKVGGTVGVAMEAHHPGHWDPEENPDHGLWGNSYLPDHSHMTLHTLHYTPDDGETWHTITGLNHPLHTDGPGEAKTAAHQEPWVEHVRVDKLLPHREWQHQPGGYSYTMDGDGPYAPKHDAESWERNKRSVAEEGVQHPLIMEYNPTTHSAYLGEGNHRLHWAHELGHETVPVRMWRTSKDMPERYRIQGEPRLTKDENGYFPQDGFKPSDVLPADYFPSQEKTAGAQGDRPELTFKHLPPEENHPYGGADQDTHTLHAYLPDGSHAGELSWFGEDGMIRDVGVHPDHRRKGIASELLRRARQIQPEIHHSDALTADGAGWAGKVAMLEYFTAVKRSDHPLAPDLPQEQHEALDTEDYTQHKRKMLDLAKNPVPGTHIWRGELRAQDPVKSARETGVGIHWGVNPDTILRPQAADGEHEVVYHAEIEHPGEQNFSRNHSMWQGRHMSMDSEAEVRLKPGTKVKLHGVWYRDPYVSEKGYFTPTKPERMGKQWSYTPINEYVDVAHRPTTNLIDYGDVGVKHEGMLGYFTAADDYRLMHRAPDEKSGKPLHHFEGGDPDDLVRIYRAAPHHVDYFDNDTWATTDPDYAHQHAEQYDGSKKWPVMSAEVPKKHVFWDENDPHEVGYQGPRLEKHEIEEHDQETGEHVPFEGPSEDEQKELDRGGHFYHGMGVHLSPEDHAFVHDESKPIAERAHRVFQHVPERIRQNGTPHWEPEPEDAEMDTYDEDRHIGKGVHDTPLTRVVVHGSQNLEHAHGISWADDDDINRSAQFQDYHHHEFEGDPNERLNKQASMSDYFGVAA